MVPVRFDEWRDAYEVYLHACTTVKLKQVASQAGKPARPQFTIFEREDLRKVTIILREAVD